MRERINQQTPINEQIDPYVLDHPEAIQDIDTAHAVGIAIERSGITSTESFKVRQDDAALETQLLHQLASEDTEATWSKEVKEISRQLEFAKIDGREEDTQRLTSELDEANRAAIEGRSQVSVSHREGLRAQNNREMKEVARAAELVYDLNPSRFSDMSGEQFSEVVEAFRKVENPLETTRTTARNLNAFVNNYNAGESLSVGHLSEYSWLKNNANALTDSVDRDYFLKSIASVEESKNGSHRARGTTTISLESIIRDMAQVAEYSARVAEAGYSNFIVQNAEMGSEAWRLAIATLGREDVQRSIKEDQRRAQARQRLAA